MWAFFIAVRARGTSLLWLIWVRNYDGVGATAITIERWRLGLFANRAGIRNTDVALEGRRILKVQATRTTYDFCCRALVPMQNLIPLVHLPSHSSQIIRVCCMHGMNVPFVMSCKHRQQKCIAVACSNCEIPVQLTPASNIKCWFWMLFYEEFIEYE